MRKKLKIALVAHDNRKAEMVEWAVHNAEYLSQHHLVCTGTTGNLVHKALEDRGVNAEVTCMHSGPTGGDAEIAAMVVRKEIDLAVFLIDDLNLRKPTSRCCSASAAFITYLSPATVTALT